MSGWLTFTAQVFYFWMWSFVRQIWCWCGQVHNNVSKSQLFSVLQLNGCTWMAYSIDTCFDSWRCSNAHNVKTANVSWPQIFAQVAANVMDDESECSTCRDTRKLPEDDADSGFHLVLERNWIWWQKCLLHRRLSEHLKNRVDVESKLGQQMCSWSIDLVVSSRPKHCLHGGEEWRLCVSCLLYWTRSKSWVLAYPVGEFGRWMYSQDHEALWVQRQILAELADISHDVTGLRTLNRSYSMSWVICVLNQSFSITIHSSGDNWCCEYVCFEDSSYFSSISHPSLWVSSLNNLRLIYKLESLLDIIFSTSLVRRSVFSVQLFLLTDPTH